MPPAITSRRRRAGPWVSGLAALALSAALAGTAAAKDAPVVADVELYASSHALVIGNGAYGGAWRRLTQPAKDAALVAEVLRSRGFDVSLRIDVGAAELRRAVEAFFAAKGGDPEGRLLVWFSGHGHTEKGEGFLVPVDAPPPKAGIAFRFAALPMRRFGEYLRLADARHVLVVVDAGLAATVFESPGNRPAGALTRDTTRPARQMVTSGGEGDAAADDGRFRELFVGALRGEGGADADGDGYLTARELASYLTDRLAVATGGRRVPRYGILGQTPEPGDFVFAIPRPDAPRRPFLVSASGALEAESLSRSLRAFDPEVSPLRSLAGRLFRVSLASGRSDEELLDIIRRIPGVGSAEVDAAVRARGGTASGSGVGRHRMGE